MRGLNRDAFAVLEDGVPQQIDFFQAENVPLDVALAIDISDSMKGIIGDVKEGARALMARLKPGDRASLIAFNDRVFVMTRQETDQAKEARGHRTALAARRTALFDAIVSSVAQLGQEISRRAVIVFTDGNDQHSRATLDGIELRLAESDVAVYLLTYGRGPADRARRRRLEQLAASTGGARTRWTTQRR